MLRVPPPLLLLALLILMPVVWVAVRRLANRKPSAVAVKPPWVYWFWRIYVPVGYVGFLGLMATALVRGNERLFVLVGCGGFPLFAAVVLAILSACAFTFEYSMFGKRRLTPLPDEPALRTFGNSYGIIGGVRATIPFVTWLVYRGGLGIKLPPLGDVFVPWELVEALELRKGMTSMLYHYSFEIRGPIRMPNYVARFVAPMLAPKKVIVAADLIESRKWYQFF